MPVTSRICMRQRIGVVLSYWTWDLVSADGETLDSSGPFSSREECCADAARQGLPVSASPYQPGKQSWTISRDQASTTWRWECAEESGAMICRSKQGFVTARECIGNARQSGYVSGIRLA